MSNFKKSLFLILALAGQTTMPTSKKIAVLTLAALTANVGIAECTPHYNDEATQALWHAIVKNDLIAAQKALEEGANPNGTEQESFLFFATQMHYVGMVNLLLLHEANPNTCNKLFGQTPLSIACFFGDTEIVRALLGHKNIDCAQRDVFGKTALDLAREMEKLFSKDIEKNAAYRECIRLVSAHR